MVIPNKKFGIIMIQSLWRGFSLRKKLLASQDKMTKPLLIRCIDLYVNTIANEKTINTLLSKKKIRLSNFPSHISENIVKFIFAKLYNVMPTWDTSTGDLCIDNKLCKTVKIEVKGSIDLENGLPTFGPSESWDYIYFLDGVENHLKKYKLYEIKLSNTSEKWKNLKINKTQTYFEQCQQKRRPRLKFSEIQLQLGNDCKLIFDNYFT
jgi:hypothetical protein